MAKGKFRFIINTGWSPEHDFTVIFSAAKGFYGRDFTQKCVQALFTQFKPLALALLGKSKSEVLAAISEAKEKNQLLYDCAITTANAQQKSDPQCVSALTSIPELGKPDLNGALKQSAERKPADPIPDQDLFKQFDDD